MYVGVHLRQRFFSYSEGFKIKKCHLSIDMSGDRHRKCFITKILVSQWSFLNLYTVSW